MKRRTPDAALVPRVRMLLGEEKLTFAEIAERFGFTKSMVRYFVKKHGLEEKA